MHFILFSRTVEKDLPNMVLRVYGSPDLRLIHFGDYDRLNQLYVLDGPYKEVKEEFSKLKEKLGESCKYIDEGDTPYDLEDTHTWLWKQYIKGIGIAYIPTVSL